MSEYLTPRLTTIQVPIYDLGVNAAKNSVKRITAKGIINHNILNSSKTD
jgi:DNA-binding LacI/PurR family transcriptional regulator